MFALIFKLLKNQKSVYFQKLEKLQNEIQEKIDTFFIDLVVEANKGRS